MTVRLHDARGVTEGLPVRLERKFYMPPGKVELAYGLLLTLCRPDREYPAEQINSLYYDTRTLDELERSFAGDFYKHKVRLRWYGDGPGNGATTAFLELKSRRGFASTKQRLKTTVPSAGLAPSRLASGVIPQTLLASTLAEFGYFPGRQLLPVIKISYLRFRFRDALATYSLALDCHIRSTLVRPELGHGQRELELAGAVLELKGPDLEIPADLKRLQVLEIDWTQYSKYSACLGAHRETPGTVGWTSPPGRNVADTPVMLGERQVGDWARLFGPASQPLSAAPDAK